MELFTRRGYAKTSVGTIAKEAGVAVDTVYAAVGRKPQLLLAAHDLLLAEGDVDETGAPVPALQRRYVTDVRAAADARAKIRVYTSALVRVLPRTAPLQDALREASRLDDECRATWDGLERRRAANMRLLVADLRATGELRADLDDETIADLIWSLNSSTFYTALAGRGWTPERYATVLDLLLVRTLLSDDPAVESPGAHPPVERTRHHAGRRRRPAE